MMCERRVMSPGYYMYNWRGLFVGCGWESCGYIYKRDYRSWLKMYVLAESQCGIEVAQTFAVSREAIKQISPFLLIQSQRKCYG